MCEKALLNMEDSNSKESTEIKKMKKKMKKADDDHSEQQQQQKIGRIYHMNQSAEEYYGGLMQQYEQLLRLSKGQYKQREAQLHYELLRAGYSFLSTWIRNNPSANAIDDGGEQQPQGQQQQ